MKKSKIVGTIIAAIIIVVGVFVLVYNAVIIYNSDLKNIAYGNIKASVSTVQSTYVDGAKYYKATYSFQIDSSNYTCSSDYSSDVNEYVVGDTATVRYDKNNPSNNYLVNESKVFNYLYLSISCILLIIGIKLFDKQTR